MHRALRRAAVAAGTLVVLTAAIAMADTVRGDSDTLTAGFQSNRDLGLVAPGAVLDVPVTFTLACANDQHVDPGQSVRIAFASESVPPGGAIAFDPVVLGPTPTGDAGWPADGTACSGQAPITANGSVTVTAPTAGGAYDYSLFLSKTPTPAGTNDAFALTGLTAIGFTLQVVDNTPPTVTVPASMTVEGNTTGGATVTFTATTSDAEDDPAPAADCSPASGAVFPLGTTTVTCTVTDSGGLTDEDAFGVTVVDTTAPVLHGVPDDLSLATTDPAGAVLDYDSPTASDVVDPSPSVGCNRAPGVVVPVGDTTVTCTATDDSGNTATASFGVHVSLVSARWDEPVGAPATITANPGRTIPVKVELFRDGVEVVDGRVSIVVLDASGAKVASMPLAWSSGRWFGHLDTTGLAPGSYRVVAKLDGLTAGAFRLDLRVATTSLKGAPAASPRP